MLLAFFAMLARRVGVPRLLALPMARETLATIFDPFFVLTFPPAPVPAVVVTT